MRFQGGLLISTSTAAFVYVTLWLLFTVSVWDEDVWLNSLRQATDLPTAPVSQPFIEEGHPLHKLFPPPESLFLAACFAITLFVACICIHVGSLIVRDALKSSSRS